MGSLYAHTLRGPDNHPTSGPQFQASGIVEGFEKERITISHYREVDLVKDGTTKFQRESFYIYIDLENRLFGSYYGFARRDNNHFSAEWMLEVEGGTGIYENATGNFIEHVGVKVGFEESPVYEIDFSGTIFIR